MTMTCQLGRFVCFSLKRKTDRILNFFPYKSFKNTKFMKIAKTFLKICAFSWLVGSSRSKRSNQMTIIIIIDNYYIDRGVSITPLIPVFIFEENQSFYRHIRPEEVIISRRIIPIIVGIFLFQIVLFSRLHAFLLTKKCLKCHGVSDIIFRIFFLK